MAKKRCKLSRREYEDKDHSSDKYRCRKCGRTARKEKSVCKVEILKK